MRAVRPLPIVRAGLSRLLFCRRGATAIEYGLIAALIVIAMVASFTAVANVTVGLWGNTQAKIGNATGY